MKIKSLLITGMCMAALTLCLPISASAQSPSPSPKSKASPTEKAEKSEKKETASTEKAPRSIPFRGNVNEVDADAKTFTIGKTTTRTLKITDKTTITKNGADAEFTDITAETYVTGSYWKQEDGTFEARSVKAGGPGEKKAKKTSKKKKTDKEEGEAEE
ncbi:hypothetical protein BH20VER1_BH20VER1_14810 [soil metagenome]